VVSPALQDLDFDSVYSRQFINPLGSFVDQDLKNSAFFDHLTYLTAISQEGEVVVTVLISYYKLMKKALLAISRWDHHALLLVNIL